MSDYKLNVGDMAPDISCQTWPEGGLQLSDFRGKWVVLYFYPKDSTPGCTTEAGEFRDNKDTFTSMQTEIIGVSRDSVRSHQNFATKHGLNFTLISDQDEVLCRAFDVIQMKKMYGRESMGVERSTFIINPEGQVVQAWRKVRVKGHVDAVLEALRELQS